MYMTSIITLFDQHDIKFFFDTKTKKLVLKKKEIYYNIALNSDNIGEESLKQQVDNIFSIISAIKVSGRIGPDGPQGIRGKQGGIGKKGDQGEMGKPFEIELFCDSELDLPDNADENKLALIKDSLNLYIRLNNKWTLYGNLNLIKGEKGERGDQGVKGDQGDKLHIDYICNSIEDLSIKINLVEGQIALIENKLDLYLLRNNEWVKIGKLISDKGEKGDKGIKGDKGNKGDKGDSINFSYIVSNKKFLPTDVNNNVYALVRNTLEIYYHNNDNWDLLGCLKGEQGKKGNNGDKGDKGDMGDPFTIKYIYNDIEEFNCNKDSLDSNEYDYMLDKSTGNLYQYSNFQWIFKFNLKGPDGEKGDGLHIDLIINNTIELLNHTDKINKFALEKNTLSLYYNLNNKWILIGDLKGVKGIQGQRGKKGDIGCGLKIDHYVNNVNDILSSDITLVEGNIIYLNQTKEFKYYDGSTCKDISIFPNNKINLLDIKFITVCESHQNIALSRLFEIKSKIDEIDNSKINVMYKIKFVICWKASDPDISKDFYKDGMLFFAEHNNILVENSTKFIQGFPMTNTFTHEFLVCDKDITSFRFFIKVNYCQGSIETFDHLNLIQIKNI